MATVSYSKNYVTYPKKRAQKCSFSAAEMNFTFQGECVQVTCVTSLTERKQKCINSRLKTIEDIPRLKTIVMTAIFAPLRVISIIFSNFLTYYIYLYLFIYKN